jgi:hypothetical protein
MRESGKPFADSNAVLLFEKYLREIEALINFVDQIDK